MSRRLTSWVVPLFAVLIALMLAAPGGGSALAAPGPSVGALRAQGASEVRDVFVRLPQGANLDGQQPLQVLVTLHGMGDNGPSFGGGLAAQADAHGWVIVAPTIGYGDWTDPSQIAREEPALIAWLADYVRHLSDHIGYPVQPRILLFGHSRGAQLSLRFTEVHPELVQAVSAVSAGTYTLPYSRDKGTGEALRFPFGVADLASTDGGEPFDAREFESVPVWIGVGGSDNRTTDVPGAWSPYIGETRLARAKAFTQALQDMGANVSLKVFPFTDHTLTDDMRAAGCDALAGTLQDATGSAAPVA
jgi:pimeloyl-ACP methyl ester carboxylesterase